MSVDFNQAFQNRVRDNQMTRTELRQLKNIAQQSPGKEDNQLMNEISTQFRDNQRFNPDNIRQGKSAVTSLGMFSFEDDLKAPSVEDIKAGKEVLGADPKVKQEGPAVKILKQRLNDLGFPVSASGKDSLVYGNATRETVKQLQLGFGIYTEADKDKLGKVDAKTWLVLNKLMAGEAKGEKLAGYAADPNVLEGTYGDCFREVADAADATIYANNPTALSGDSAYMAADQLAADPNNWRELRLDQATLKSMLPSLPAGAVVVWGQGSSAHGHISIADGQGNEISDHLIPQEQSHYGEGGVRVFFPVGKAPDPRPAAPPPVRLIETPLPLD